MCSALTPTVRSRKCTCLLREISPRLSSRFLLIIVVRQAVGAGQHTLRARLVELDGKKVGPQGLSTQEAAEDAVRRLSSSRLTVRRMTLQWCSAWKAAGSAMAPACMCSSMVQACW